MTYQTRQFHRGFRVGFEVTGVLAFEIETYLRSKVRQIWQESSEASLESMVPEIANALRSGAAVGQAWDEEETERRALAECEAELRLKARREAELESARWNLLVELATKTSEVHLVTDFIQALTAGEEYDPDILLGDRTLGQWLEWLELVAERRGGQLGLVALFSRIHAIGDRNS